MDDSYIKQEYPTLTAISKILLWIGILAIIIFSTGILLGIIVLSDYEAYEIEIGITILAASISGLLFSLLVIGFSELTKLFIKIEYNTKIMSEVDTKQATDYRIQETPYQSNNKTNLNYDEWKKDNPGKSINDYYSALQ